MSKRNDSFLKWVWGESELTVVGDSKILTVSYGTFSCTLEGFDDPFSTMKAIAEYFRDLAAGDRFFGAEPPQPDTDLLHKIAEQTIQQRVNAELTGDNLVLRQAEPAAAPAPTPSVAPVVEEVVEDASGASSVAEKLKRIRAVVASEAARNLAFSEDQHADGFAAPVIEDAEIEADEPAAEDEEPFEAETLAEPAAEYEDDATLVSSVGEDQDLSELILDEDTVEDDVAETAEDSFEAAEDDEVIASTEEPSLDRALHEMQQEDLNEDAHIEETVEETASDEQSTSEEDVDLAAFSAELSDDVSDELEPELDATAEDASDEDEETPVSNDLEGVLTLENPVLPEDQSADVTDVSEHTVEDLDLSEDSAETDAELADALEDEYVEDLEDDTSAKIVVQRISRADLQAETPETFGSFDASDETDAAVSPEGRDDDVDDMEAELARELDDIEEIVEDEGDEITLNSEQLEGLQNLLDETAQAEAEDARQARIERRSNQPLEDEDAAFSRLMDTTNKLEEDGEGSVRRASIAHLKAAVAANKADASIAEAAAAEDERELDQYREDLARVVRPGRAKRREDGELTVRPTSLSDKPSPLVLVGEQRIDDDAGTHGQSTNRADVQPRRISTSNLAFEEEFDEEFDIESQTDMSFADYLEYVGAQDLPEHLEAAAAYITYIEGRDSFTRPMLMRKMDTISDETGHTREANLRSFGTLLRQGKLVKNKDGNFVIAKSSRFTPEARYAGE
ncbi:MAG: hypothetical protein AAGA12_12680 [Pseudomonadota bacterium]